MCLTSFHEICLSFRSVCLLVGWSVGGKVGQSVNGQTDRQTDRCICLQNLPASTLLKMKEKKGFGLKLKSADRAAEMSEKRLTCSHNSCDIPAYCHVSMLCYAP